MKVFVTGGAFVAAARTYTFPGAITPVLERILTIVNTTDNIIIYNPVDPALGGTLAGQVLTLTFDTTAMANGDSLMVYYDDPLGAVNAYLANGAVATLMGVELNALANGAAATAAAAFDNTAAATHWLWGDFELLADGAGNFTAGNTVDLYLLEALDGTNYPTTTADPANAFIGSFVCQAEHPGRYILRGVPLPAEMFKAYLVNNSGQAFAATLNTLKMLPYRTRGAE